MFAVRNGDIALAFFTMPDNNELVQNFTGIRFALKNFAKIVVLLNILRINIGEHLRKSGNSDTFLVSLIFRALRFGAPVAAEHALRSGIIGRNLINDGRNACLASIKIINAFRHFEHFGNKLLFSRL